MRRSASVEASLLLIFLDGRLLVKFLVVTVALELPVQLAVFRTVCLEKSASPLWATKLRGVLQFFTILRNLSPSNPCNIALLLH